MYVNEKHLTRFVIFVGTYYISTLL